MIKVNDGGPAFPHVYERMPQLGPNIEKRYTQGGMTLRDWFAGQALAGRMARNTAYRTWSDAAADAYEIADAMLAERARGTKGSAE